MFQSIPVTSQFLLWVGAPSIPLMGWRPLNSSYGLAPPQFLLWVGRPLNFSYGLAPPQFLLWVGAPSISLMGWRPGTLPCWLALYSGPVYQYPSPAPVLFNSIDWQ